MKWLSYMLLLVGGVCIMVFGYQYVSHEQAQKDSLEQAEKAIAKQSVGNSGGANPESSADFEAPDGDAFATLEIPKLDKVLPVVEGADPDALAKGVGHLTNSVYPGQNDQIVLSGHRDTVFRQFDKIEIGDHYQITTPYGTYTYEIKETEIVSADDTSVIGETGEEVLVVTTCYPFEYVGNAPERFVTYAYPVDSDDDQGQYARQ
ncbi:sortase A [Virgibacillus natechei]|uniref:Sortase A n=1 Tax=Virgibacillus natechei TaxID=1216297 RepID=A0ABS4IHS3_9BACI|nr:class D sortase [Virgibacillus natechei]MBP1970495.1 sortase A [Virgibacillus natechei]UZD14100.1 class D sortase [Virgibacillus natechei]